MAVAPEASRAAALPAPTETAEELFHEHSGWLYGYCLRVLRSPEEAEDAVQTTYLNAYRSLQQGTQPRAASAWLLHIARNVCLARIRSLGRRTRIERPQDAAVLEETAVAPSRFPDELIGLTEALGRLPERQREAILLREWQGLSYGEVGERLGLTQSAVETLIFRARRSLAAELSGPGKPRRRTALHSLDLGALAAVLKGFFTGGAGVKTVAALTVAAATTTVVAADPVGILHDRQERPAPPAVVEQAQADAEAPALETAAPTRPVVAPFTGLAPPTVDAVVPGRAGARQAGEKAKKAKKTPPGEASEKAPAAASGAKGKARANGPGGNGRGKALGLAKQTSAAKGSEAQPTGPGKPDSPGRSASAPEPEGQATGEANRQEKAEDKAGRG